MRGRERRCDRWGERQTGGFSRSRRCQLRPHRGRSPNRLQQLLGRPGRRSLLQVRRRCRISSLRTGRRRTPHLGGSQLYMQNPAADIDCSNAAASNAAASAKMRRRAPPLRLASFRWLRCPQRISLIKSDYTRSTHLSEWPTPSPPRSIRRSQNLRSPSVGAHKNHTSAPTPLWAPLVGALVHPSKLDCARNQGGHPKMLSHSIPPFLRSKKSPPDSQHTIALHPENPYQPHKP